MNEKKQDVTKIDLSILDLNFYRVIYQRIVNLKKQKEKGGEENADNQCKSI